jgi:hypothetical protein
VLLLLLCVAPQRFAFLLILTTTIVAVVPSSSSPRSNYDHPPRLVFVLYPGTLGSSPIMSNSNSSSGSSKRTRSRSFNALPKLLKSPMRRPNEDDECDSPPVSAKGHRDGESTSDSAPTTPTHSAPSSSKVAGRAVSSGSTFRRDSSHSQPSLKQAEEMIEQAMSQWRETKSMPRSTPSPITARLLSPGSPTTPVSDHRTRSLSGSKSTGNSPEGGSGSGSGKTIKLADSPTQLRAATTSTSSSGTSDERKSSAEGGEDKDRKRRSRKVATGDDNGGDDEVTHEDKDGAKNSSSSNNNNKNKKNKKITDDDAKDASHGSDAEDRDADSGDDDSNDNNDNDNDNDNDDDGAFVTSTKRLKIVVDSKESTPGSLESDDTIDAAASAIERAMAEWRSKKSATTFAHSSTNTPEHDASKSSSESNKRRRRSLSLTHSFSGRSPLSAIKKSTKDTLTSSLPSSSSTTTASSSGEDAPKLLQAQV